MTILYKLTDADGCTMGATRWGAGVTHRATGAGAALCTTGVIHAYRSPGLALLMAPAHVSFDPLQMWRAAGDIVVDGGTKVGVKALTTLRRQPAPDITLEQAVSFGVRAARACCAHERWLAWAELWLAGAGRSFRAAWDAASAVPGPYSSEAAARAAAIMDEAGWTSDLARKQRAPDETRFFAALAAERAAHAGAPLDFAALADEICGRYEETSR